MYKKILLLSAFFINPINFNDDRFNKLVSKNLKIVSIYFYRFFLHMPCYKTVMICKESRKIPKEKFSKKKRGIVSVEYFIA